MSDKKEESQPSTLSEAEAEQALAKAEYEAAKAEAGEKREAGQFSNKRKQDRIFRREMGEPEFFLMDRDIPLTPILTGEQIEEIAREVQTPKDQTPQYNPENILSPEFGGGSNYETGIADLMEEAKQKLNKLLNDPEATQQEVQLSKLDLKKLEYLYDNFNMGMNVFRTAKGGRDTLD